MADYKVTAGQLASIANAIRLKGGTSEALEYPSDWIDAIENLTPSSGGSEITPADPTIEYKVTDTDLTAIADAIRERGGTSESLAFPTDFVSAIENISGGGVEVVPWSTGTDEQIVAMLEAAHNGDINLQTDGGWAVGDTRTINVGAFTAYNGVSVLQQNVDIVITSFSDYNSCGNVLQFDFKGKLAQDGAMNNSTSTSGYDSCPMRTTTLANLVNVLPTWLKDSLMPFSVLVCDAYGTVSTVSNNLLALRSEKELFGDTTKSYDEGSVHIAYYDSTGRNKGSSIWTRSKGKSESKKYVSFNANNRNAVGSNSNYGISPFGCL